MKKIFILIFILTLSQSCSNDDEDVPVISACDVNNPIEDLPWLKAQVNQIIENNSDVSKYFYMEITEYEGGTIFIANNCCPICGTIVPVYNCEGASLGLLNDVIKSDEIKNSKIIFKRNDFTCQE